MSDSQQALETKIISSYLEAVGELLQSHRTDRTFTVIGPLFRPDGDYVEVEITPQPDGMITLSDKGMSFDYLFVNGLDVRREEFRKTVSLICRQYGAEVSREEIRKITDEARLGADLHQMLTALLAIGCLTYRKRLITPRFRRTRFDTSIGVFLRQYAKVGYTENFFVDGKVIRHCFRYFVNGKRNAIVQPIDAKDEHDALNRAIILSFEWLDIEPLGERYKRIAVVDNIGRKEAYWEGDPNKVLQTFSDKVIFASDMDALKPVLTE